MVEDPAIVRAPVPVEELAAALRVPAPLDLAPDIADAPAQALLLGAIGVEVLAGAEEAHHEIGGLDDVAPVVLAAERDRRTGGAVHEMREGTVIAGRPDQDVDHAID